MERNGEVTAGLTSGLRSWGSMHTLAKIAAFDEISHILVTTFPPNEVTHGFGHGDSRIVGFERTNVKSSENSLSVKRGNPEDGSEVAGSSFFTE